MSKEKLIEQRLRKKRKQEGKEMLLAEEFKRMIWEEFEQKLRGLLTEENEEDSGFAQLWQSVNRLPEPSITEIGLAEFSQDPTQDKAVSTRERNHLLNYLKNIGGNSIPEKMQIINDFYENPSKYISEKQDFSPSEKVSQFVSHIMFMKTLTKIITNFNPSSAGFTYEAFLALAAGGSQINTGTQLQFAGKSINQIADFQTGNDELYSLKLYGLTGYDKEASKMGRGPEAGGSFRDLVGSVASAPAGIKYLVSGKNITGEGLNASGEIISYEFTLNKEEFVQKVLTGGIDNKKCLRYPLQSFLDEAQSLGKSPAKYIEELFKTLNKQFNYNEFEKLINGLTVDKFVEGIAAESERPEEIIQEQLKKLVPQNELEDYKKWLKDTLSGEGAQYLLDLYSGKPNTQGKEEAIGNFKQLKTLQKIYHKGRGRPPSEIGNALKAIGIRSGTGIRTLIFDATKKYIFPPKDGDLKEGQIIKKIWGDTKDENTWNKYEDAIGNEWNDEALALTAGFVLRDSFKFSWSKIRNMGEQLGTVTIGFDKLDEMMRNFTSGIQTPLVQLTNITFEMFKSLSAITDAVNQFAANGLKQEDGEAVEEKTTELEVNIRKIRKTQKGKGSREERRAQTRSQGMMASRQPAGMFDE